MFFNQPWNLISRGEREPQRSSGCPVIFFWVVEMRGCWSCLWIKPVENKVVITCTRVKCHFAHTESLTWVFMLSLVLHCFPAVAEEEATLFSAVWFMEVLRHLKYTWPEVWTTKTNTALFKMSWKMNKKQSQTKQTPREHTLIHKLGSKTQDEKHKYEASCCVNLT